MYNNQSTNTSTQKLVWLLYQSFWTLHYVWPGCLLYFIFLFWFVWYDNDGIKCETINLPLVFHYITVPQIGLPFSFGVFLTGRRFGAWGWVWPNLLFLPSWQDVNLKESVMFRAFPWFVNCNFAAKLFIVLLWISCNLNTTQLNLPVWSQQ